MGEAMHGIPAVPSMHFRNGNVAFGYLGNLLMLMVEDGTVSLDDPISRWLPDLDVPSADTVTLVMLARNTSGYTDYVRDEGFQDRFLGDPFQHFSDQDLIDIAMASPPWYPPGASWSYAHTNYVILGQALAAAGDAPLEDLLARRVIGPMGLRDTESALTPAVPDPVLHTYSTEREVFEETTFWNPSWQTARGSVLTTTICDMATSAAAVGSGALLSDASQEVVLDPVTTTLDPPPADCPETVCREWTDERYYGLGVIVWSDWVAQTPLFGGAGAVHAYLPDEELAIALVAVQGKDSEPGTNHAVPMWQSIAAELTPEHVPGA
jgi:CubicO group peptidase (beta-lactamase class C family)